MRTPLSLLAAAALAASAAFTQQPLAPPVGFVFGDGAYLIEADEVRGEGVLLAGEGVSTNVFPARLHLENGGFGILGIGSHARVYADRVSVSGVGFEMLRFGAPPLPLEAGGLLVVPASPEARVSVFTDRPEVISVMVSKGDVEVRTGGGAVLRSMTAGSEASFVLELGQIRVQEGRAALEIGRICMRQLEMLGTLEEYLPGIAPRRKAMVEMLVGASDELLALQPQQRDLAETADIGAEAPSDDPDALIGAARQVHFRLNQEGLDEAGCGEPECAADDPPRRRSRFFGWAGGFPLPPPGCALCRPVGSAEPESAPAPPGKP